MDANLALADQAVLALVHEFDRVFDRQNVAVLVLVNLVYHGGKRRGLTRAGLTCYEYQTPAGAREIAHGCRHAELFERQGLRRNRTKHGADAA